MAWVIGLQSEYPQVKMCGSFLIFSPLHALLAVSMPNMLKLGHRFTKSSLCHNIGSTFKTSHGFKLNNSIGTLSVVGQILTELQLLHDQPPS